MEDKKYIVHSAAFKLKHKKGSAEEKQFMKDVIKFLSVIPGVIDFELNEIINDSSPYDYEIAMKFESQEVFSAYVAHPNHGSPELETGFVTEVWMKHVESFLEKDTIPYE